MEDKKMDGFSFDNVHERIEALKRMFPEAVSEGRLDYDMFMALLGDEFDNEHEKYRFEWKGKLEALRLAQRRSSGTLRPDFEGSRDWDTTGNLYIEGDNLEVLKLLQQGYLRKVKMIYIDPPYNTGNDFVYEDDFADPIARYKEITGQGMRANPETAGRYHSNWLSMMYPRLKIAKTLLRDDGFIFISIDENEAHNLRKLCDEVFGEENFRNCIIVRRGIKNVQAQFEDLSALALGHEYILLYSRKPDTKLPKLMLGFSDTKDGKWDTFWRGTDRPTMRYELFGIIHNKGQWRWESGRALNAKRNYEIYLDYQEKQNITIDDHYLHYLQSTGEKLDFVRLNDEGVVQYYVPPQSGKLLSDNWMDILLSGSFTIFDTEKNVQIIDRIIRWISEQGSIILDFFSGSSTTAHAVMQLNAENGGKRKFIMVQIPEPTAPDSEAHRAGYHAISDIGKERIRRAGDKIMAEWHEKQSGQLSLDATAEPPSPPDIGFRVFRLDSSNMKKWDDAYVTPEQIDFLFERMEQSLDAFKPDRRKIDVIYEVFLKYGVPLTEKLSTLDIQGKTFYAVGENGYLFICLDEGITLEIAEEAAQYAPGTIIFADECFADSNILTNVGLMLDKAKIEFRWI